MPRQTQLSRVQEKYIISQCTTLTGIEKRLFILTATYGDNDALALASRFLARLGNAVGKSPGIELRLFHAPSAISSAQAAGKH